MTYIECFISNLFLKWLRANDITVPFDECDVSITNIYGGKKITDSTSCPNKPCIIKSSSSQRRLLSDNDGNSSITITTNTTDLYITLNGTSTDSLSQSFETEYINTFGINIFVVTTVKNNEDTEIPDDLKNDSENTFWSTLESLNRLYYIIVGLVLLIFCVGCILFYWMRRTDRLQENMQNKFAVALEELHQIKAEHRLSHQALGNSNTPTSKLHLRRYSQKNQLVHSFTKSKMSPVSAGIEYPSYPPETPQRDDNNVEMADIDTKMAEIDLNAQHDSNFPITPQQNPTLQQMESSITLSSTMQQKLKLENNKNIATFTISDDGDLHTSPWSDFNRLDNHLNAGSPVVSSGASMPSTPHSHGRINNMFSNAMNQFQQRQNAANESYKHQPYKSVGIDSIKPNTVQELKNQYDQPMQIESLPITPPILINFASATDENESILSEFAKFTGAKRQKTFEATMTSVREETHDGDITSTYHEGTGTDEDDDTKESELSDEEYIGNMVTTPGPDNDDGDDDEESKKEDDRERKHLKPKHVPQMASDSLMEPVPDDIFDGMPIPDVIFKQKDSMVVTDDDSDNDEDDHLLPPKVHTPRQTTMEFKMNLTENVIDNDALLDDIVNEMASKD